MKVTVSKRGYIVLPAKLRKELNITAGMQLLLSKDDGCLVLKPVYSFTESLAGITNGSCGKDETGVSIFLDDSRARR